MLLRNMPEPSNTQGCHIWEELQGLLQVVATQQDESLASIHQGAALEWHVQLAHHEREASIHYEAPPRGKKAAPAREHVIDNRDPHDACHDINKHRRCKCMEAKE